MRATFRRYSRSWIVHATIVAIAILIGIIVAFFARPTRSLEWLREASRRGDYTFPTSMARDRSEAIG